MIARLRSDPYRDRESATIILSDVPAPKPCSHTKGTEHARFRPTPIRCHSQKRQVGMFDDLVFANCTDGTGVRAACVYLQLVVRLPPPASSSKHALTLDADVPGRFRYQASQATLGPAPPCLRPVAYRNV